jgi:hypothetical protein
MVTMSMAGAGYDRIKVDVCGGGVERGVRGVEEKDISVLLVTEYKDVY